MNDIKPIIESIYRDYNPDKLSNVPELLLKYQGKEAEMLSKLCQKYNFQIQNYISADPQLLVNEMLHQFDPNEVSTASSLLTAYKGRENELLASLAAKYNTNLNDLIIAQFISGSPPKEPVVEPAPVVSNPPPPVYNVNYHAKSPNRDKGKKGVFIGLCAGLTIIAVLAGLFFGGVFKSGKSHTESTSNPEKSPAIIENKDSKEADPMVKVKSVIEAYYTGLLNKNFDATLYFANNIERFITMLNTNPQAINSYINSSYYKEFIDARNVIESGSFVVTKEAGNRYTVEYIENGTCFRKSLHKYQNARVNVKTILNSEYKIVSFHPYHIIENVYSDSPKQNSTGISSENTTTQPGTQNKNQPFYIISVAAVKNENQARTKVEELKSGGNAAGYLWIPDYASLSEAQFYCDFGCRIGRL